MKTCAVCTAELTRRPRESFAQFASRQCCSKRCALILRQPHRPDIKARYRYIKIDGRKVAEHRYVMEQVLGRPLSPDEQVHHRNGDRLDNRPDNLEVVTAAEHGLRHTKHPTTKRCVICREEFTPHATKRARAQTCGPRCLSALLSLRNAERRAS